MMPSYYDGDAARLDSFSHQKCDGLVCQVTHKSGKTSAMVKKAMMMPSLVEVMMKRFFLPTDTRHFVSILTHYVGGKGLSRLEHPQRKNSFGHFEASPISSDRQEIGHMSGYGIGHRHVLRNQLQMPVSN